MDFMSSNQLLRSNKSVDVVGAILAGLSVGYFTAWARDSGELQSSDYLMSIFLAACSYTVAALLMPQPKGKLTSRIPRWMLIAVAGSILTFLSINIVGDFHYIMRFEAESSQAFAAAMQEEILKLIFVTIVNSCITLPIMGVVHRVGQAFTSKLSADRSAKA